ncbi:crnA, partial [Symbiodinium pilosum]
AKVQATGLDKVCLHSRHGMQVRHCQRGGCVGSFDHLRENRLGHPSGAVRPRKRAMRADELWRFLGFHGSSHHRTLELHPHQVLH